MKQLDKMLKELDTWLGNQNKRIELRVIGGYAMDLKKLDRGHQTEDIDPVSKITNKDIVAAIHSIGDKYGNKMWMDFGAASLIVPDGYEDRMDKIDGFSNIDLYVLSDLDLIKMKVAAYYSRGPQGIYRDLEDLKLLKPTKVEIRESVDFLFQEYSKDLTGKFKKDFKEETEELLRELLKICKD